MSHSPEGLAFLTRLNALPSGPGVKLDDVLQPSLKDEEGLRKLFAQDKSNPRLQNPHVGLVDVFGPNTDVFRKTRARVVDYKDQDSVSGQYIMPLEEAQRRKDTEASMVANMEEFRKNWSIFTEGSLSQLFDWNNVIAAGGSVLSSLLPLTEENKKSKRAIRKYYHSAAFPTSDVDLFLWGLTPEQAENKIVTIYEAVRDSVPWDVTCIRTKHTVSIHSQYPYRSVQIVLRLYQSPAEVLAGFDIDAPCCAYDGEHVWANPRALTAIIRQCNTIDVTRRSPSYEVRLAKYAKRGFEIYVPGLRRQDIDPTIYERSIVKIEGLARLLVLEKLHNTDARHFFLESRRGLRGRPFSLRHPGSKKRRRLQKGDLKTNIGGLEVNDYDVATLHIPYGPGWDARRIERLIYQTDLGMNSTFNPKNKGRRLHRHPAFFGTVEESMEDCCEHCPLPIDDDERKLQKEEDEHYIRGRIYFMQENPGRQTLSGSFNPIDEGEWAEQVYMRPIQTLFQAIAVHDITLVRSLLEKNRVNKTIDLQNRDHVGRTALHLAILVKDEEIAKLLIEEGCRMIARIVDGRTALHMAAQYGLDSLIEFMFETSKANMEEAERKERESGKKVADEDHEMGDATTPPPDTTTEAERPSSEDDWSSDENDGKEDDSMNVDKADEDYDNCEVADERPTEDQANKKDEKEAQMSGEVPEDGDEPDVLNVNVGDWDQGFTPLCYAVLYGTSSTVDILLRNGADPNQAAVTSVSNWSSQQSLLPLFLTLVRSEADEDVAVSIAERLIDGGAKASAANDKLVTVLHFAVFAKKAKLLDAFLRKDPGAKAALDFPTVRQGSSTFPVVSAIAKGSYATLLTLLAHGAKINPAGADVGKAKAISNTTNTAIWGWGETQDYSKMISSPVEAAIARGDHLIDFLLGVGADVNSTIFAGRGRFANAQDKKTILDWVSDALEFDIPRCFKTIKKSCEELVENLQSPAYVPLSEKPQSWKEYLNDSWASFISAGNITNRKDKERKKKQELKRLDELEKLGTYLQHVRAILVSAGAKTWEEVSDASEKDRREEGKLAKSRISVQEPKNLSQPKYVYLTKNYRREWVQPDQAERYDELFEAAYRGDDAKIEQLCCVQSAEESDATVVPVRVTVEVARTDNLGPVGLTPLCAAIAGRRWNTAKLIMAIAAAQYHDESDDEKDELQAALFDLVDDKESEVHNYDSDYDSDCSDDTINDRKRQAKFVDIAKKISVRTDIHPSALLNNPLGWVFKEKTIYTTPLLKAIKENDLESAANLFSIQFSFKASLQVKGPNQSQDDAILHAILDGDNPKLLDELIRRTGVGIDVDSLRQAQSEDQPAVLNDQNRLYLGLNIHGKKRTDLARKGAPGGINGEEKPVPLVWDAIRCGAKSIIEYLASEKPLAAYKHFSTTGEGDRAELLRHSKSLETSLREWLGWTINPIGESPLAMAVLENKKEVLPVLFAQEPKLMGSALHTKIKFTGFNLMLLAASKGCDKEIFEFLLKKGVSPTEVDSLGRWNIYHWICRVRKHDLLKYLLEYLPREVSEELLAWGSKEELNTPLQIAVKEGSIRIVETIVNFTTNGLLTYDAGGFTPLHSAIRFGFVGIAEMLVKVLPSEGLYLENGVGKTPYEFAEKLAMMPTTASVLIDSPGILGRDASTMSTCRDAEKLEKELQNLRNTLRVLLSDGVLEKGSALQNRFEKFISATAEMVEKLRTYVADAKAGAEDEMDEAEVVKDSKDVLRTLDVIAKAVGANGAKRSLIHLKDVQKSVAVDLDKMADRYSHKAIDRNEPYYERPNMMIEDKGIVYRSIDTGIDKCYVVY